MCAVQWNAYLMEAACRQEVTQVGILHKCRSSVFLFISNGVCSLLLIVLSWSSWTSALPFIQRVGPALVLQTSPWTGVPLFSAIVVTQPTDKPVKCNQYLICITFNSFGRHETFDRSRAVPGAEDTKQCGLIEVKRNKALAMKEIIIASVC